MTTKRHLVIGCGYLGRRVAQRWLDGGADVLALTRSADRAAELEAAGLTPLVGDVCGELPDFPEVDVVLYAVGFDRRAGRDIHEVYVDGLRRAIDRLRDCRRFVYVSSTGVFGNSADEWVDEDSDCHPTRAGGKACLAAEKLLAESRFGSRSIVLRMAGLYGPGRLPRRAALLRGEPLDAPGEGFLNLIHVEDAANIAVLAAEQSVAPRTYCVSDGVPCRRREYLTEAARLLGAPAPQFAPPDPEAPATWRAAGSKRVSSRRLLAELPISLQYPAYREGLAQIVSEETTS